MLSEGDPAPDFDLTGVHDGDIGTYRLSNFARRGVVVLAFYPFDFAPWCADHVRSLRETDWLDLADTIAVLGISTDGPYAHEEFAARHDLPFPLLSDGSGYVAETYDVLADRVDGVADVAIPANVVVDPEMRIRYVDRVDDPTTVPDLASLREAVAGLDS